MNGSHCTAVTCGWESRKNRAGENAKTRPQTIAAATPSPSCRARTYAPTPHSTGVTSSARLRANTGLPVSHMTGAAKRPVPIRFSE